jgi:hypothetical protein
MCPDIFNTISSGGGDFSLFATWEAATDDDLVTSGVKHIGMVSGRMGETNPEGFTSWAGAITNASFYRVLAPFSGTRHNGISDFSPGTERYSAGFVTSGGLGNSNEIFQPNENYLRISGLFFRAGITNNTNHFHVFVFQNGLTGCVVDSCLFVGAKDLVLPLTASACFITNNIVYGTNQIGMNLVSLGEYHIYNNTIFNTARLGGEVTSIRINSGTVPGDSELFNNIATNPGVSGQCFGLSGLVGANVTACGNMSSDHTAGTVLGGQATQNFSGIKDADIFVDADIDSLRPILFPKSINVSGIGKGVNLTHLQNLSGIDRGPPRDIFGNPRPTGDIPWDVGAIQFDQTNVLVSQDHTKANPLSGIYKFHKGKLILPSGSGFTNEREFDNQLMYNSITNTLFIASGNTGFAGIAF